MVSLKKDSLIRSRAIGFGWVLIVVLIAVVVIQSCGGGISVGDSSIGDSSIGDSSIGGSTVRGLVVGLESKSLTNLYSITLMDQSNREWYFIARGYQGFSPSHLKQHMLLGDPVLVVFHEDGNDLIVDDIEDWIDDKSN